MYTVVFTRQAMKDRQLLRQAGLEDRAKAILNVMARDPFRTPPPFEKLVGDLAGFYSRRLNRQHRIVYQVDGTTVKVLRMWTHYE